MSTARLSAPSAFVLVIGICLSWFAAIANAQSAGGNGCTTRPSGPRNDGEWYCKTPTTRPDGADWPDHFKWHYDLTAPGDCRRASPQPARLAPTPTIPAILHGTAPTGGNRPAIRIAPIPATLNPPPMGKPIPAGKTAAYRPRITIPVHRVRSLVIRPATIHRQPAATPAIATRPAPTPRQATNSHPPTA